MIERAKHISQRILRHRYGLILFAFLVAAMVTGISCASFMRLFDWVLARRLDFNNFGVWCWLVTPLVFLISVELIRRTAPCAAGTGIPQAIFAAEHLSTATEQKLFPLVSPWTLVIKTVTLLLAVWVGASTGREGPTVHIATCIFFLVLLFFRRFTKLNINLRSVAVAGAAAGLAAAFNTPLAGVTFAIEELTPDYFSGIKDYVLIAIIAAAIAAKSLTGEYTYFGRLTETPDLNLTAIILTGLAGGVLGAFFSTAILVGQKKITDCSSRKKFIRYLTPLLLSCSVLVVALFFGVKVLGPGNVTAQNLLKGEFDPSILSFPLAKIASTLFTYWSGIAGGVFAPCLSIGAAMGADIAHWLNIPVASCALIGMGAFLSGAIQAPITSFVIIFEMTGHHQMLLPIMLSSLLAYMIARLLKAKHLYKNLSTNYAYLLGRISE